ncbi:Cobyrinic acid ac-diamide synthase [Desulfamplus magnetovallimortis]|uniref:Cobyrinic acid ac-diamide synthase n=1 Tax=Desulfamplus magnetovallimortis TaxID=1246637 RepID=A0A1W1HHM5_9BACT|nr:ParA family protein [Desulfamplus magnetovallimortis]SLM31950.1 Cobyrinic acid ac-diamide synthase [Desulfamplus magnetovallimortis]
MGYIISIINNKGGCGKTTTTCNLADALGRQGKSVLVMDIDGQCNATGKLLSDEITIDESMFELLDPNDDDVALDSIIRSTECKNVDLLPNIPETTNLEVDILENAPDSFFRLRKIIREYALQKYHFTLIDCPPNMGTFVLCALYVSDSVIIPVRAGSADSVEGLMKATKLIERVKEKGNSDLGFLRILINGRDKRTAISNTIIEKTRSIFKPDKIFNTQIPLNTAFEKAEALNKTIFQAEPSAPGARAFSSLAKELIEILGES